MLPEQEHKFNVRLAIKLTKTYLHGDQRALFDLGKIT